MKSVCASLEDKMLQLLRAVDGIDVPIVGLLEQAGAGTVKQEDLTALQLRVYGLQQLNEGLEFVTTSAELRLTVMQADSADGAAYRAAHEAVALWLQEIMLEDNCTQLHTDEVYVDGLQLGGGDADFDTSNGVWFAVWNITLTGRLK